MKRFGRYASVAIAMCCMSATIGATPSTTLSTAADLHISDGKLYRSKDLVADGFSVSRTGIGYIFIYAPELGLITISTQQFPGADSNGTFKGSQLRFTAGKERFVLTASTVIVDTNERPAWVSVDRAFSLRDNAPLIAYGDSPRMPYHWPMYRAGSTTSR